VLLLLLVVVTLMLCMCRLCREHGWMTGRPAAATSPATGAAGMTGRRRCGVLKRWLLRHGDAPYPSTLDKRLLADRSNMTVVQVRYIYIYIYIYIYTASLHCSSLGLVPNSHRPPINHTHSRLTALFPGLPG